MADGVTHWCSSQGKDLKVLDMLFSWPAVVDLHNAYLDVEGSWDLSDILLSDEIKICASMGADLTDICNRFVDHLVRNRTTAGGVFKLESRGLNSLRKQLKLIASVDRLHNAIMSSRTQIKLLPRQDINAPCRVRGYPIESQPGGGIF